MVEWLSLSARASVAPLDRFAGHVGDHAVTPDVAKALPFARAVRRPGRDSNSVLVQRGHHLFVEVVIVREAPGGAEPRGVLAGVDDVAVVGDSEGEGNAAA